MKIKVDRYLIYRFYHTSASLFQVGWYVTLHVTDVPSSVMESVQSGKPLLLVSLLPHEQKVSTSPSLHLKRHPTHAHYFCVGHFWAHYFSCCEQMSVMHVLVRRHPSNTEPIKSKEELVFHCGFRRFRALPIFSQHTLGRTSINCQTKVTHAML